MTDAVLFCCSDSPESNRSHPGEQQVPEMVVFQRESPLQLGHDRLVGNGIAQPIAHIVGRLHKQCHGETTAREAKCAEHSIPFLARNQPLHDKSHSAAAEHNG
jgi:hypothetical protein